ncbi:hypothetical protein HPB51_028032 [Rhipicephalus microplus]|uniref:Uncharacterized protein n=1 Tax=Rhipicephalus microplus TaxID=6941 RepID=A0A9J6CYK4_RHIMP|nr:hypothetical protein HPB51_028032 [Rhipicephalus microplus]
MSKSKCKRLGADKSNISSSKSAEGEEEFKADEVFDHETRKPKLTKEVLSDHSPLFKVIYEDLYTFVYFNFTDDEDDRLAEPFTEFLNGSILQDAIAGDGMRQGKSLLSSDSSVCVLARGGGDNDPATCRTKNASSRIPLLHLLLSWALQVMQQTCDAKVQVQGCQPARTTELKSDLQKRDVKITQLKPRPNAIPESQAHKPEQIYDKIRMVEGTSPPPDLVQPRTTAKSSNVGASKKNRKSRSAHEPGAQAKPRPFSNSSPPHQPKAELKPIVPLVHHTPSLITLLRSRLPPRHRRVLEKKQLF